jgi:selenide,water dikinase
LASNVSLAIDHARIEFLPAALDYSRAGYLPGGLKRNCEFLEGCVEFADNICEEVRHLLFDPQTSGGLLLAVEEQAAASLVTALRARSIPTQEVGEVVAKTKPLISVR